MATHAQCAVDLGVAVGKKELPRGPYPLVREKGGEGRLLLQRCWAIGLVGPARCGGGARGPCGKEEGEEGRGLGQRRERLGPHPFPFIIFFSFFPENVIKHIYVYLNIKGYKTNIFIFMMHI